VDRRFVYVDPHPDRVGGMRRNDPRPPGFFSVIFGSLSSIPREQPVRDNLDAIAQRSHELDELKRVVETLRPDVEAEVERLFGRTLLFEWPSQRRLTGWRGKAQDAAAKGAGYAYHGYGQVKLRAIVQDLAQTIHAAAPDLVGGPEAIERHLATWLNAIGFDHLAGLKGGASAEA
ncbi:MAG: DUF3376 domain-containing protein, partial [Novosphingobium sp.]